MFVRSPQGKPSLETLVESIDFELHETFHPRVVKVNAKGNNASLNRIGWGTFRINITVHWRGQFEEKMSHLHHDLLFEPRVDAIKTIKLHPITVEKKL